LKRIKESLGTLKFFRRVWDIGDSTRLQDILGIFRRF
jgi:hypothetical protein